MDGRVDRVRPDLRDRRAHHARHEGGGTVTLANVVFLIVLVLAAGFFSFNVQRLVRYLGVGHAEDRTDHPGTRLRNVLTIGIAQARILRDPIAGALHAMVFWGFLVITVGTIEIL